MIRSELTHAFHELNPASRRQAAQWRNADGPAFLQKIGLRKADTVIDFGCGPGSFCIPAAQLVGTDGRVYAVDRNPRVIKTVQRKVARLGLPQLRTLSSLAELGPGMEDQRCNVALLFDVLHFFSPLERKELYAALHDLMADNALLSTHLKHVMGDDPTRYFMTMTPEAVVHEIEEAGYRLSRKLPIQIWHSHGMENSVVYNFVKLP